MVPLFAFLVAGRLIARFGPGRVIAAGATVYAAGATWWTLRSGLTPNYAGEMLPGMLLTGIGVGLTLPTFMSTGASALPPHAFATGSAVVNMLRQVGLAVGVAVLVAVIGTPHTGAEQLSAFQHGWIVIASASLLAAIAGGVLLSGASRPRRDRGRESARWSGAAAPPPALPERQ
jgi:MFS family permease